MGFALSGKFWCRFVVNGQKQQILLGSAFIVIALKQIGKIEQQLIAEKINNPNNTQNKDISQLFLFGLASSAYVLFSQIVELIGTFIEGDIMHNAFVDFYKKFIQYRFNDWKTILEGNPYSNIFRRSKALSKFFKVLFFEVCDVAVYIAIGLASILRFHRWSGYIIKIFLLLVSFPIIMSLFSILRTRSLEKLNKKYDLIERKVKDIFLNYEMIHTYNTMDLEVENYSSVLKSYFLWFRIYWILENIINFSKGVLTSSMVGIMFKILSNEQGIRGNPHSRNINETMNVLTSILKRLASFTASSKRLAECNENISKSRLDLLLINPRSTSVVKKSFNNSITVENMSKTYGRNIIFDNINLTFFKGEKVAITGTNGSGKSSFIKSILGFEKCQGTVSIDGKEISSIENSDFRRLIAYVPQDNTLFDASIFENLVSFDSIISEKDVLAKADQFGMHDELKSLGYDKMLVGRGNNISATQRQKICLLRAIIRDAPILILDETTSDMDKDYEERIVEEIFKYFAGKTVVMIIHNLDLLKKFDKVVFFSKSTSTECLPLEDLRLASGDFEKYYSKATAM